MIARWLPLYLRSRRVPLAVLVSLAAISVVTALWSAWSGRSEVDPSLSALTVVLALAPLIPTLAGDDDALEKTAALPWPPRRMLHLVTAAATVAAALAAARAAGVHFGPAGQILRDSAGVAGLIGLGVALVGTRLAWAAPLAWAAVQAMVPLTDGPLWRQALLWLMQPETSNAAAITAGALFLAGLVSYAMRAGPPMPPNEVTIGQ